MKCDIAPFYGFPCYFCAINSDMLVVLYKFIAAKLFGFRELNQLLIYSGVGCTVMEKSDSFSHHPQAHFINNRTMEVHLSVDMIYAYFILFAFFVV